MMRALASGILIVFGCYSAYGQAADTFEVASVKPSLPPDGRGMRVGASGGPGTRDPGRWTAQNMSLSNLVTLAYYLSRYEYSGPGWLDDERFDIVAKVPEGSSRDQFRSMLQNLLAERFKLAVHREGREMTTYEIVVAKNGPKLTESVNDPRPASLLPGPPVMALDKDGYPELPPGRASIMRFAPGRARVRQHNCTMQELAALLASQIGKPVNDATGLKGKYDFVLSWSTGGPLRATPPPSPAGAGAGPASIPDADSGPTLFGAVQDQLGLRLESKKSTVEVLIVDRAERVPTEN